ncbi:hypothetical protein BK737_21285 [Bacillus thuringiensis serovar palmanyolensis]|nr:hypothetical protein BK737_21285 [Bacillus thuringiensis serovar palmanyolensis]
MGPFNTSKPSSLNFFLYCQGIHGNIGVQNGRLFGIYYVFLAPFETTFLLKKYINTSASSMFISLTEMY